MTHLNGRTSDLDKTIRLGAIALASGASMLAGGAAHATIIEETYGTDVSTGPSLMIGDGSPTYEPQYAAYPVYNGIALFGTNGIEVTSATIATGAPGYKATDLSVGDSVGPLSGFVTLADTLPTLGAFYTKSEDAQIKAASGTDYLGLQFSIDGGSNLYGYMTLTGSTVTSITYDDTGSAITVGATPDVVVAAPEPASLALLAMGAAGIAGLRRRRKLAA